MCNHNSIEEIDSNHFIKMDFHIMIELIRFVHLIRSILNLRIFLSLVKLKPRIRRLFIPEEINKNIQIYLFNIQ